MKCEDLDILLSGYIDNELTQQDRQRVEVHLADCTRCRKTIQELEEVRRRAGGLHIPEPTRKEIAQMESNVMERLFRNFGWSITIAWAIGSVAYGLYEYASAPGEPFLHKVAVFSLILGIAMLFLSVLLQRVRETKTDRYKGIQK